LSNRPSIIPAIFTIFTSERHLKVLIDKENAVIIGTAIDELVRHHPLLKAAVFASLKSTFGAIEEIGRNYQVSTELLHWYRLAPAVATAVDIDVKMEDFESIQAKAAEVEAVDVADEAASKSHDNTVVSFIDVLCRVCSLSISRLSIYCLPNSAVS
jgi:E3 ubiquitin-protein ligase HUWE1